MTLLPRSGAHSRRRLRLDRVWRRPSSAPRRARRLALPRPVSAARGVPGRRPSRARRRGPRPRPVERRRARALLMAAVAFATVVLLGALPWSTLADQHAQLSSASAELSQLQAENHELAAQAGQLSNRSTQAGLARQDYGLVKSGQKAYDILPPSGTAAPSVTGGGHVPLDESPVVPGSRRSEALLGVDVGSVTTAAGGAARTSAATPASGERSAKGGSGPADHLGARSFWSRVAHTLEFWS